MIRLTVDEIAGIIGATPLAKGGDVVVRGVSIDTRTMRPGDLFVALDGASHRGSDHIAAAMEAGACAAVSPRPADGAVLVVDDADQALAALGAAVRERIDAPVIAITGSNGKTTTKDCLAAILATKFRTVAAERSFNNKWGVPLTLCRADEETEVVVLEVGTNSPGEIAELARIARPSICLITNVGPGHLAGLGGLDGVLVEKLSLTRHTTAGAWVYVNGDDDRLVTAELPDGASVARRVTFGLGAGCDVKPLDAEIGPEGVSFRLSPQGPPLRAPLRGQHNLMNLLAASAVARDFGMTERELQRGAAMVKPPSLRMETRSVSGMSVTLDCYNANPASMGAALDEWMQRPSAARRVAVIGDMLELGDHSARFHRELGRRLASMRLDRLVLVGDAVRETETAALEAGLPHGTIKRFGDVVASRNEILGLLEVGDDVLLKGSRGVGLERLFENGRG